MSESKTPSSGQPDKNLAAETRPVPSQAEGELETVETDLAEKGQEDKKRAQTQAGSGSR